MRAALSLIDMAAPYINVFEDQIIQFNKDHFVTIKWKVGGCSTVDSTRVYYAHFKTKKRLKQFRKDLKKHFAYSPDEMRSKLMIETLK